MIDWMLKTLSVGNVELKFIPFEYLENSSGISSYAMQTKLKIPIQNKFN